MSLADRLRGVFADTRPLREPHFRRLWTANIVTVIGAQLTVVAVPAQIYAITGSSGMVGLTGVFGLVPLIVFGLWGGALADHFDRRRLLEVTTLGLVATSALFWLQAFLDLNNVWLLLGLFSLQQAFFAVNQPTRTAILPKLIPIIQLPAANALNMTVMSAGAIAGPLVGGALIPVLGYSWLYLIDTVTLLATLYAVYRLPPLPVESRSGTPGLRSVLDGLRYLTWHRILLLSFLVDLIAMVFGMPRALYPEIAHVAFGGPDEGGIEFALLYAAMPAGAVLGGVFSGWVVRIRRQGAAVLAAIAVWGAAMALLGAFVGLAPLASRLMLGAALGMLIIGGAADMVSAAFRQTILLSAADDDVRGRLQGVFIVVVAGGPRIADVLHGAASEVVGPAWATGGGGLLVLLGIAVVAAVFPVFRRYRA
ncbi:Predicted arabinose efflux permease, MFS family [Tessaracoccus bendigoensis DSM 12906]|uniref:Predicted arabinose efflux permease, MFS family n=1 Tax=Tessaracoccus bendigoensis DSM 12906 TaxID=1123357 RepID=A0A1M6GNE0_9ACTN|nr:MFS transporter [Tessaracoccus bendigoensis]SHJ11458.1 Predicted arabinose efflux permease, MFS family [Tessaracoccus bendigoensis DSM 12906]